MTVGSLLPFSVWGSGSLLPCGTASITGLGSKCLRLPLQWLAKARLCTLSHRLAEGQAAGEWSHPEIYRRDGDTPQGLKAKASRWLTTAHPPVSLLFRLSDVSQFVKRIRTFMTETLTGPLLQTCVQKADSLTDCRTLSTAGFQGRANTDTRGAHLFETTLKLRSDMQPDTHIGYGPRTHEHSFKCACDALQLRSRLSHRLAVALTPRAVYSSLR